MRFLRSLSEVILDRAPEELIGSLLVAAGFAIVVAGVYAFERRRRNPSPTFVGGLAFATAVACLALAAGYIRYAEIDRSGAFSQGHYPAMAWSPTGPRGTGLPTPGSIYGMGWSTGFHVVIAADENHDGRLTTEELVQLLRKADADGDGSVNVPDIDHALDNRFQTILPSQPFSPPTAVGTTAPTPPVEEHRSKPPETPVRTDQSPVIKGDAG